MRIGFDLDKIFIDYPPFIPTQTIDWLYRHSPKDLFRKNTNSQLSYHIPKPGLERLIRRLSHLDFLRPKITSNAMFLSSLGGHSLYLISSRYKFLENLTLKILGKYDLITPFTAIYLNNKDLQPHKFKEQKIKELNLDIYLDDDLRLLKYLKSKDIKTKLLWYNPKFKGQTKFGIPVLASVSDIRLYLKK
ncbi:MAG: hypothetical protein Q7S88_02955 [Candidatus Daviesbacteria bacterium]|nr:hypothetical protein [Candidatus Daviesbacteria bacterium]